MADLLTPALLAAIDWDEYQRYGRELPPSAVDWIKQNGKPNTKFEFKMIQKAVEREEKLEDGHSMAMVAISGRIEEERVS